MLKTYLVTPAKRIAIVLSIYFSASSLCFSNTTQTEDVPGFHNDDGLGLLQDCTFMRAIANGSITDAPNTVHGRSVGCLSSIKSVAQVLYSHQESPNIPTSCLPSADLDWLEVLNSVIHYMEEQPKEILSSKPYGVWIMQSLNELYPCK